MADKDQQQLLLSLLLNSEQPLSLSALNHLAGKITPERTLRRWLQQWLSSGQIRKIGQGRATQYYAEAPTNSLGFLQDLDKDLKVSLLKQLRDLWTHTSTALEGNTLSLGDTHFLLEEGLTISGKPLKDHQEIIGHAKAIELLYQSLVEPLNSALIFELHKAILTEQVTDIYKPQGAWKIEVNGTYATTSDGQQHFIEYAKPQDVPELMEVLIDEINRCEQQAITMDSAHLIYAKIHMGFAHIHPFWDGNGRLARLLANVPLLKAGLPPLVISQEQRREYIQTLAGYQVVIGQLTLVNGLWPNLTVLKDFEDFCQQAYSSTQNLLANILKVQKTRKG